jgi:uncharacterized low-complexity protein
MTKTSIAFAGLIAGFTAVGLANAADNPFAVKREVSGFLQLAEQGEGKCGGAMDSESAKDSGAKGDQSSGDEKKDESKCGGSK